MQEQKIQTDYDLAKGEYKKLQEEAFHFVSNLDKQHRKAIHVAMISQRPGEKLKKIEKILANFNSGEYKKHVSIFNLKDIAGVRVTCHCEDDVENFAILLEGELKQNKEYSNVDRKDIGGRGNEYPYRAVHITFSKKIKIGSDMNNLHCEIQIRTVMADAWAVQNHKYLYKKIGKGENHELASAVSEIMTGCEKLWSLVKKKSEQEESIDSSQEIEKIHKKLKVKFESADLVEGQKKKINNWLKASREKAFKTLNTLDVKAFMEVEILFPNLNLDIPKNYLKDSAQKSTIRTFGWPIGVFLDNREEYAPKVDLEGIHAEILTNEKERKTFDYWAIHQSASFYLLKSIFEDSRKPTHIFFNTRIVRITEVLMYLKNLYTHLEIPRNAKIELIIRHGGLKGRLLGSSSWNRELFREYKTITDIVPTRIITSIEEIDASIVDVVEKFTKPLFEQFEFFELDKKVLKEIVSNYVNGKIV